MTEYEKQLHYAFYSKEAIDMDAHILSGSLSHSGRLIDGSTEEYAQRVAEDITIHTVEWRSYEK